MNFNDIITSAKTDEAFLEKLIKELVNTTNVNQIEKYIQKHKPAHEYEKILDPNERKLTIFPIKYPTIWQKYMEQLANFWTAEEIDFSNDYNDFMLLNKDEQLLIEMILAFFAASDGIVNINLGERFIRDVQITEAIVAYQFQEMMENIHGTIYSQMLDNIIRDPKRKDFLFNAIENIESVKMMKDWAFKWVDSTDSFAHRLIAFAVVEGIFFSGAFAAIFWLKKYKNKHRDHGTGKPFMEGLIKSNKFISRDESSHTEFAFELYSLLENKLKSADVNEIVRDGVRVAQTFMTDAIPVRLIGMNNIEMNNYIECIADRLLVGLGYRKIYNKQNPFKFMETIGLSDKSNLHEVRPHEYQSAAVMNVSKNKKINISDDF